MRTERPSQVSPPFRDESLHLPERQHGTNQNRHYVNGEMTTHVRPAPWQVNHPEAVSDAGYNQLAETVGGYG